MIAIMSLPGTSLKPFLNQFQPILVIDALRARAAPQVFRAAAWSSVWLVIVPAKLTWLIQPVDARPFYKYNLSIRKRYLEAMARSAEGELQLPAVLIAVNDAVRYVCQAHEWSKAFDVHGFEERHRHVRQSIVEAAGITKIPLPVSPRIPCSSEVSGQLEQTSRWMQPLLPSSTPHTAAHPRVPHSSRQSQLLHQSLSLSIYMQGTLVALSSLLRMKCTLAPP